MAELYVNAVKKFGSRPFLGTRTGDRPYVFETYEQVVNRARNFGAGLLDKCQIQKDQFVAIFSKNSAKWAMIDIGCVTFSIPTTALYETLDPTAIKHILNHTNVSVLCMESKNLARTLKLAQFCKSLKYVVIMDEYVATSEEFAQASSLGLKIFKFDELESFGSTLQTEPIPPKPNDVFTVCYTSGTSGLPKGAIFLHSTMIACGNSVIVYAQSLNITEEDVHLSYLPLAHSFERVVFHNFAGLGGQIGFFRGTVEQLFDDIQLLAPTIFCTVPRLLERVVETIKSTVASGSSIKKLIFDTALSEKLKLLRKGKLSQKTIWDKLVFDAIRKKFGGRLKIMLVGSAPSKPETLDFLRAIMGCPIVEGYGQTENCAGATSTILGDYQFPYGPHIGVPFVCNEIKLIDVPDMGFFATDEPNPRGEICIRGPNVIPGYWNDPDNTAKAIDSEGWLRTQVFLGGDIGELLPNGTLKIIDRNKAMFKLAQGEFISPEKGELVYGLSKLIAQIVVHGESSKSTTMAIVVPDFENLKAEFGDNPQEIVKNEAVKAKILAEMQKIGQENHIPKFEIPKAVLLLDEPFSVENELLTPTFKVKRREVLKKYKSRIEAVY
ncbi:Long-chain-fatty-acid--CoA ligase 6 [Nowakowskiella sp. JEL0407]|nr:Long-chain-fatty-acid--CoA ligase 6 [Nowakowskiella sp. JEL0407]